MILNIILKMLTNIFKVLVNNSFKKSYYREKKYLMSFTGFFISYKSGIKIFLKWIVNQFPKDIH